MTECSEKENKEWVQEYTHKQRYSDIESVASNNAAQTVDFDLLYGLPWLCEEFIIY